MKLSLDRTFRVVWLVVGGLLLLFLVVGGLLIATQWISNAGASEDAVRVANESQPAREEPRAVRYGPPASVRGTSTRLVLVSHGEGYESSASGRGYAGDRGRGSWVNAIFLNDAGARLLLDRPAYIQDISAPRTDESADSLQTWITYVMALDDSDRNGRLDQRDRVGLYVSDVEGRSLRPALRPPLRFMGYEALPGGRMLIHALEAPPGQEEVDEKRMRQRAFIYDVASGQLSPYAALDSAAARAAQILGR